MGKKFKLPEHPIDPDVEYKDFEVQDNQGRITGLLWASGDGLYFTPYLHEYKPLGGWRHFDSYDSFIHHFEKVRDAVSGQ
jgi:hypothetical protein